MTEVYYLDGRYFELALKGYPGRIHTPYNVYINFLPSGDTTVSTDLVSNSKAFRSSSKSNLYIIRLIINIVTEGTVSSKHSNLLLINELTNKILRYEPILNNYDDLINQAVMEDLKKLERFKGYIYEEVEYHPQPSSVHLGLCIAYIIKFASDLITHMPTLAFNDAGMLAYAESIVKEYGELPVEGADVEFGGFGAGLLGGVLLGGLVAAPLIASASQPRTTVIYQ